VQLLSAGKDILPTISAIGPKKKKGRRFRAGPDWGLETDDWRLFSRLMQDFLR
jgi:hypothetical protein